MLLGSAIARADAPAPDSAGPNLGTAKIQDVATWVSVPLSSEKSLALALPDRFWIQCPRHSSVPTSLDGDGLVLQYMNARGGSHSLIYVGSVPLPRSVPGEKPEVRLDHAAAEFVGSLREKYARVDFHLREYHVASARSTVVLGGKKVAAVATAKYVTPPAVAVSGPDSTLTGECVVFVPEGIDRLVYVAVNSKAGGTSLDRVTAAMTLEKTADLALRPRVVQLNDIANGRDDRYPVRLVSYDSPPGFAPTIEVVRMVDELVYAEDRRDAAGVVTGTLRFDQHDVGVTDGLGATTEEARKTVAWGKPSAAVDVALATEGVRAKVFRFVGQVAGRDYVARRAIAMLDDKALEITWSTFSDAALEERDAKAFDRMLSTMRLATRSKGQ